MRNDNKGIALIAVIAIILIVAAVITGITIAVVQGARFTAFYAQRLQALAAAEAGVYAAIADYKQDGFWRKVSTYTNIDGSEYYKVGNDANFLLIDASLAKIGTGFNPRPLSNFSISNINFTQNITIKKMRVSWTTPGIYLQYIILGGQLVWDAGSGTSGSALTLKSGGFTLSSTQTYSNNVLMFTGNINAGDTITVTFEFGDTPASSRTVTLLDAGSPTDRTFSITSTGKSGNYKRTIEIVCGI